MEIESVCVMEYVAIDASTSTVRTQFVCINLHLTRIPNFTATPATLAVFLRDCWPLETTALSTTVPFSRSRQPAVCTRAVILREHCHNSTIPPRRTINDSSTWLSTWRLLSFCYNWSLCTVLWNWLLVTSVAHMPSKQDYVWTYGFIRVHILHKKCKFLGLKCVFLGLSCEFLARILV